MDPKTSVFQKLKKNKKNIKKLFFQKKEFDSLLTDGRRRKF
jgi:hypothetical protein